MEDNSVNSIRESSRNTLKWSRRFRRDEESDISRSVENMSISMEDIASVAEKLKTKSSVSLGELLTLKNGLMEHPSATAAVLSTHGALRGLVRELTGSEVNKQCAAAACLCNVALGEGKAAAAVARGAGPYLVAALDSLTMELASNSAWCIGAVCGAGRGQASMCIGQGAVGALSAQLARRGHTDIADAAAYALLHLAYSLKDELSIDHLTKILHSLQNIDLTTLTSQLLFVLSCHKDFVAQLTETVLQKVLDALPESVQRHSMCVRSKSCCQLVYLIRVLANVEVTNNIYKLIVDRLWVISDNVKTLLTPEGASDVTLALYWLLGNLFKFNGNSELFSKLIN